MQLAQTMSRAWQNLRNNLSTAPAPPICKTDAEVVKDWAVLVYLEGEDGLAYSSSQAVTQLKDSVGDSIYAAVQHQHQSNWREKLLPGMGAPFQRRYQIASSQLKTVGEGPQSLADFVSWGMEKFPAKNYAVVVKRHGLGFLDAKELRQQLEQAETTSGKKPALLALDSCLMQQAEVAYELRNRAEVLVASQNNVSAGAFPYAKVAGWLTGNSSKIDAENLGRLIVEGHRLQGGGSICTATRLASMEKLAQSVAHLSDTIITQKVPPQLVYTSMMQVAPIEGQDPDHVAFDFRDLSSFVQNLAGHPSLSNETVQRACFEVYEQVQASLLRHHVSGPHALWNNAQGFTTYMPWSQPEGERLEQHRQLDYAKESGWGRLLEYAHRPVAEAPAKRAPESSTSNLLSKTALYAYKKYVSPYLGKACTMTPSCSAYARQAIETHGLWEGVKFATVRLCSCNGSVCGCNPVPGAAALKPVAESVPVSSAPAAHSPGKTLFVGALATATGMVGKLAGATLGAVVGGPAGLIAGAVLGYQAGKGQLDAFNQTLFDRYQPASPEAVMEVEAPLVKTPIRWQQALQGTVAEPLSGVLGGLTGAGLGLLGGAAVGVSRGQKWAGLMAANATRDAFGMLPPNPNVEKSLASEHAL